MKDRAAQARELEVLTTTELTDALVRDAARLQARVANLSIGRDTAVKARREAEAILRTLAELNPVRAEVRGSEPVRACTLCTAVLPETTGDPAVWHDLSCPWRRARDYQEAHP
jgi:hypothetical protein